MTACALIALGGCTITEEGVADRAMALLAFADAPPMHAAFHDPSYYLGGCVDDVNSDRFGEPDGAGDESQPGDDESD
jgi:hypothetical protein